MRPYFLWSPGRRLRGPRRGDPRCYDENVTPVCHLMNRHYFKQFLSAFIMMAGKQQTFIVYKQTLSRGAGIKLQ